MLRNRAFTEGFSDIGYIEKNGRNSSVFWNAVLSSLSFSKLKRLTLLIFNRKKQNCSANWNYYLSNNSTYWVDKNFVHVFPQEVKELFGQHNTSDKFCATLFEPPKWKSA